MAQVSYVKSTEKNMQVFTWTGVAESDTFQPLGAGDLQPMPVEIGVDAGGTFGGSTVSITVDGGASGGVAANDLNGTAIAITSPANVSVGNLALSSLAPSAAGGSSQSLNVVVRLAR